jgi:hypothetical protein
MITRTKHVCPFTASDYTEFYTTSSSIQSSVALETKLGVSTIEEKASTAGRGLALAVYLYTRISVNVAVFSKLTLILVYKYPRV